MIPSSSSGDIQPRSPLAPQPRAPLEGPRQEIPTTGAWTASSQPFAGLFYGSAPSTGFDPFSQSWGGPPFGTWGQMPMGPPMGWTVPPQQGGWSQYEMGSGSGAGTSYGRASLYMPLIRTGTESAPSRYSDSDTPRTQAMNFMFPSSQQQSQPQWSDQRPWGMPWSGPSSGP